MERFDAWWAVLKQVFDPTTVIALAHSVWKLKDQDIELKKPELQQLLAAELQRQGGEGGADPRFRELQEGLKAALDVLTCKQILKSYFGLKRHDFERYVPPTKRRKSQI